MPEFQFIHRICGKAWGQLRDEAGEGLWLCARLRIEQKTSSWKASPGSRAAPQICGGRIAGTARRPAAALMQASSPGLRQHLAQDAAGESPVVRPAGQPTVAGQRNLLALLGLGLAVDAGSGAPSRRMQGVQLRRLTASVQLRAGGRVRLAAEIGAQSAAHRRSRAPGRAQERSFRVTAPTGMPGGRKRA